MVNLLGGESSTDQSVLTDVNDTVNTYNYLLSLEVVAELDQMFSSLRRLNIYLRNRISQDRMSSLALFNIEIEY